jgi:Sulfotransferase family
MPDRETLAMSTGAQSDSTDRFVFVGGLHRSGTTLLAELLGSHPELTTISGSPASHDEGQHLQDVIPTDVAFGGPGVFAFDPAVHLTEADATTPDSDRARLRAAWRPYTDPSCTTVVEKSPPNLLRFRYLQRVFDGSSCIAIVRHPIAVAHATEFWADTGISRLLEHWVVAHERFAEDAAHIARLHVLRYEDLVADPNRELARIHRFLGVAPVGVDAEVRDDTNRRYFARFRHSRWQPPALKIRRHVRAFEERIRALGYDYSLRDQA